MSQCHRGKPNQCHKDSDHMTQGQKVIDKEVK